MWADGRMYEGDFQMGEMNGQGVMTTPEGYEYRGEWRMNTREGENVCLKLKEREY